MVLPNSWKDLKSFFGKINFVKNFISGFVDIVCPLNDMLKKDAKIEWNTLAKEASKEIKISIATTLVLVSPNYLLPFKVYSSMSEHSCVGILTQKKEG